MEIVIFDEENAEKAGDMMRLKGTRAARWYFDPTTSFAATAGYVEVWVCDKPFSKSCLDSLAATEVADFHNENAKKAGVGVWEKFEKASLCCGVSGLSSSLRVRRPNSAHKFRLRSHDLGMMPTM
jgi:hypothetical protein